MRLALLFLGLMTTAACGVPAESPAESTPSSDPDAEFAAESWGIGTTWYDYDGTSHAVTPRAEVYAVVDNDRETLFEITTYYDDRGTSGHVGLATTDEQFVTSGNIKDDPVCATLVPLREVECGDEADLYMTVLRRPLPDGGFAVRNPGVWVIPKEGRTVYRFDADSPSSAGADWREIAEPVPSVANDAGTSRISDSDGVHIQIDGDLGLTAWKLTDRQFDVRCGKADWALEEPLREATSSTVELPAAPGLYSVNLCDGDVEGTERVFGLWPDGEYDLVAEVSETSVVLTLHPGSLHWRWSTSAPIQDVSQARVWDGYPQ